MKWFLDFGHGGKDSGAVGTYNTKESDVVLKIGMIIKENLEKHNQQVITTRQNDKYYSLDYRSKKANENKCDYFVSIHIVRYGFMMKKVRCIHYLKTYALIFQRL